MSNTLTRGIHHVGLTVTDLELSSRFFTDLLGWEVVGGNPDYPAVFLSDGTVMVTLWQAAQPAKANAFDKNSTVGLHHLAIRVPDLDTLETIHQKLLAAGDVMIEFAPEYLREGPTMHMMCYEPGGIRIEFIVPA